ncbi:Hypothetical_protein [Hexamita inflata]|uniref:Hypothetical_protein n=1 Tax=Hexamita inflata TaxID=28002 RepID=A0AA86NDH1_9EUKA|nr:Hypothetical protein HINF_LOCUS4731 [Hexamita inflata]
MPSILEGHPDTCSICKIQSTHQCFCGAGLCLKCQTQHCLEFQARVYELNFDQVKNNTIKRCEVPHRLSIEELLKVHDFITITQVQTNKVNANRKCSECKTCTFNQCTCGVYFCRDCHVKHLLITLKHILTGQ